jgi:hypothetical protein
MTTDRDIQRAKLIKRVEETRMVRDILNVLSQRLHEAAPRISKRLEREDKGDFAAERKIIRSMNNIGLGEGVLAGIVTFLVLRRGPDLVKRMVMRRSAQRGGYQLDRPDPFSQPSSSSAASILGGMKLALDVFVSTLMAASASYYFTDERMITATAAQIPLVEGKSLFCDEFCDLVQQQVSQRSNVEWKQVESPYLQSVYGMAKNCQRRKAYENKLREEQGLSPDASVAIPPPGVPLDTNFDEYTPNKDDFAIEGDEKMFDDTRWAEDFVTDQKDQDDDENQR